MRTRIHMVIAAVSMLACAALAGAEGMTLKHIAQLRNVGDAVISPNGDMIAYTLSVPRKLVVEDDGGAWRELHVMDERGESRPFIAGDVNVGSIDWLPDGSAITFLAKRDGDDDRRLYQIAANGGEAQPIATLETSISSYSFSPDGRKVALLAFEPEDTKRKKEKSLGFDQYVFEEEWKPRRLYVLDLMEEDAEPRMLEIKGSVQDVYWSPAGDRFAMTVTPRELVDDTLMFNRIRIVSRDGDVIGRIDNPGKLGELAWSPNGDHLAFIATESIHDTAAGRLMVAGKNGGAMSNLLPDLLGHVRAIGWQDRDTVLFISHEGVESRLGSIRANGRNETTLLPLGGPIWTGFTVADNGDIALLATTPEHPAEVFRLNRGESVPQRLTNSNPWLNELELGRQEVVTYNARDGLPIEGMLVYPLNYQEGQRYPLILAVHGGPESHYSNGWLTRYTLPAHPARR